MSKKARNLSRLTAFLDVRGLVTNVSAGLILVILVSLVAVGVAPIRNALEGFFTSEIWVWTLVLALVAQAGLFRAVVWFRGRRRRAARRWVAEVPYGGVVWPVTRYYNVPEYKVDPPVCPVDKTQLGLVFTGDEDEKPTPVARFPLRFSELRSHLLKFKCLKCSAAYDLSGLGYGGGTLLEMVQQLALGEERARQS